MTRAVHDPENGTRKHFALRVAIDLRNPSECDGCPMLRFSAVYLDRAACAAFRTTRGSRRQVRRRVTDRGYRAFRRLQVCIEEELADG